MCNLTMFSCFIIERNRREVVIAYILPRLNEKQNNGLLAEKREQKRRAVNRYTHPHSHTHTDIQIEMKGH